MKVFSKDRLGSPTKEGRGTEGGRQQSKNAAGGSKSKQGGGGGAGGGQKAKVTLGGVSRPASSSTFDATKAHWTLKWISDSANADQIDIRKDLDRLEEIKAMKRAWESHEPGRFAKALLARGEFLKSHLVKQDGSALVDNEFEKINEETLREKNEQAAAFLLQQQLQNESFLGNTATHKQKADSKASKNEQASSSALGNRQSIAGGGKGSKGRKDKSVDLKSSLQEVNEDDKVIASAKEILAHEEILLNRPPTPPKPKVVLPPIDVSPFVKSRGLNNGRGYIFKNDKYEKEQDELRKTEYEEFLAFKDQIIKFRDEERKYRLQQKIKQIEECEELQVCDFSFFKQN
jgi:hypothetical protein